MRVIAELGLTRIDWETIDARGERFALGRMTFHVSDFTVAALGVVGIERRPDFPRRCGVRR